MELIDKFINKYKIDSQDFFEYLFETEDEELEEFIETFRVVINNSYKFEQNKLGFNFIANTTLSGLSFPCSDINCRGARIDELIRNASLYADVVYILNPFDEFSHYKTFNEKTRLEIISSISLLLEIRPLLEEGIFRFAKSEHHFCNECYTVFKNKYDNLFDEKINISENQAREYILKNIDFYLIKSANEKCIEISGGNDFLEHPIFVHFVEYTPDTLKNIIIKNEKIKLTNQQIEDSGVINFLLNDILKNIRYQHYYSNYYSANALVNSEFEMNMLKKMNNIIGEKGNILSNISHYLPFIDKVPLKNLLSLRKKEGEAFKVYRDKMNKIITTNISSQSEAKDLFQDIIQPEINKINNNIKVNKSLLWGKVSSKIILGTAYVSASMFTGILPKNIDSIVASIGGLGFLNSINDDINKLTSKSEIKRNELYFLWKLQKDNKIEI